MLRRGVRTDMTGAKTILMVSRYIQPSSHRLIVSMVQAWSMAETRLFTENLLNQSGCRA